MDILIKDVTILTSDAQRPVIRNGWLGVEDGHIVLVCKGPYGAVADKVVKGEGRIVLPGLVNAHTHMFQTLGRGIGDDLALHPWLERMSRLWRAMTTSELYAGTLLGAVEAVKSGTTCVINHQNHRTDPAGVLKAVEAMNATGLRGVFARGCPRVMPLKMQKSESAGNYRTPSEAIDDLKLTEQLIQEVNSKKDGLVKIWPGFTSLRHVGDELILKAHELAQRYGVGIHAHVSEHRSDPILYSREFGSRPIEVLHSLGVLSPLFHIAHGIWLSTKEIELLGRAGGSVIHNPVSNMYLADGVAPIPQLMKAGATIALGSDGPASNNTQDMFGVMKTALLLHKVFNRDPAVLTAEQALRSATLEGAKTLGPEANIGIVQEDRVADLIVVNMKKPHIQPVHRESSSLVYCCQGSDVESVIINGKLVMENRVMKSVNEEKVMAEARRAAYSLVDRAALLI